jgi:ankyrin repeat protein
MIAAGRGNVGMVKFLLENKADVNVRDEGGYSALMMCGNKEILELLIAHGADVNASTKWGSTRLSDAAKDGRAG